MGTVNEFKGHFSRAVNEYLERLDPEALQKLQQKQVYELIRRKTFDDAKFHKK